MLTDAEKVEVRRHAGYPNVQQASTFEIGVPAGIQTMYVVEGAMNRLLPEAEPMLRSYLAVLNGIEQQVLEDQENLAAEKVDTITVNLEEFEMLMQQYKWWQAQLCNLLSIEPNPFDMRPGFGSASAGGLNARVVNG